MISSKNKFLVWLVLAHPIPTFDINYLCGLKHKRHWEKNSYLIFFLKILYGKSERINYFYKWKWNPSNCLKVSVYKAKNHFNTNMESWHFFRRDVFIFFQICYLNSRVQCATYYHNEMYAERMDSPNKAWNESCAFLAT